MCKKQVVDKVQKDLDQGYGYSICMHSNLPVIRDKYKRRLEKFFDFFKFRRKRQVFVN
jgi:hypothetical protein